MRRRDVGGQTYGLADWLALVGAEIGPDRANADYERMATGGLLIPADRFAPCFDVVPRESHAFQLGFARASLNDDRIVRDLQPGSAAAQAGLRDGDVLIEVGDVDAARKDQATTLRLTYRRGSETKTITYLPRGPAREGYGFARDAAAPPASCQF
jgi:predicted metalloprotease with PDZ domain